jgi:hypothetical protein
MPFPQQRGNLSFRWSVNGIAISGVNGSLQKASSESVGEEYTIKDAAGKTQTWLGYDPKEVLDFELIVSAAGSSISASAVKPSFGDVLTVTDTLNNLTGSFVCQSAKIELVNTEGAKIVGKGTDFHF